MVTERLWATTFREAVRRQRTDRHWSQAELAKQLAERGFDGFHATTVAKIESGERSVRIDEAVAFADVFESSVDALIGRGVPPAGLQSLVFALRETALTTQRTREQVGASRESLQSQLVRLRAFSAAAVIIAGHSATARLADSEAALSELERIASDCLHAALIDEGQLGL